MTLELRLFGPPLAEVGGTRVTFDTRKAVALVAYLHVAGGTHSRDHLAALLWPEGDIAHARGALRRTLSSLRRHLPGQELVADRNAVELTGGVVSDVSGFRALIAEVAEHHDDAEPLCDTCVERLDRAASMRGGAFMDGFELRDAAAFDEWRYVEDEALRRELAVALQRLTSALSERGDHRGAIATAARWVELDPLHEPAHVELMRLHALNEDRAAALEQYRKLVRILDGELGVTPLEETIALERAIAAGGGTDRRRARVRPDRRHVETPFVGRAEETASLARAIDATRERGAIAIIEGEAGVGKTRLAREAARRAALAGATVVEVASHEEERDHAYGLIARLLAPLIDDLPARSLNRLDAAIVAEVARLAPEIRTLRPDLPPTSSLAEPGAKTAFFHALWEFFAAACTGKHTLVLLDDVHWSDGASLEVISFFTRRLEELPVLLLFIWRREDVPREHRLRRLASEARRARNVEHIGLSRLVRDDVERIVQECLPETSEETTERVYRESEGLPFFVSEYVGLLSSGAARAATELPPSALDLIRARLDPVAGISRQVLTAASVLGRSFDLTLVQATAGRSDEETVDALDELVGRGLIVETQRTGDPTYDFTHEKIRSLVYEETSLARRRLLHGRAADLLTSRRARFRPGDLALAAYHAENAGRVEDAAALHLDAGERARELFANAEALAHFQRALALGHPDAALVHEAIGDMEVLLGRYEAAVRSFETAAAYAASDPVPDLERKLADVRVRTGDDAEGRRHLERALNLVAAEDPLRAELLADASHAWSAADPERAAALAKEAVDAGTRLGATGAVARARNQLGLLARRAGDLQAATTHLRHSLEAAEADGEIHSTVAALNNLALVHRQSGELAEAVELTKRALELCTRRGDVHRQAALHNNLADLMHALGDEEASQEHARAAARLFASVGDEPVTPPAIWRLTAW